MATLLASVTPSALAKKNTRHILMVDTTKDGYVYVIDGRLLKKKQGLLMALSITREGDPDPNAQIDLLVHQSARLSDVYNLIGIIIKAGYSNYRIFVFDSDKKTMNELEFAQAIPFSPTGADYAREPSSSKP